MSRSYDNLLYSMVFIILSGCDHLQPPSATAENSRYQAARNFINKRENFVTSTGTEKDDLQKREYFLHFM